MIVDPEYDTMVRRFLLEATQPLSTYIYSARHHPKTHHPTHLLLMQATVSGNLALHMAS